MEPYNRSAKSWVSKYRDELFQDLAERFNLSDKFTQRNLLAWMVKTEIGFSDTFLPIRHQMIFTDYLTAMNEYIRWSIRKLASE